MKSTKQIKIQNTNIKVSESSWGEMLKRKNSNYNFNYKEIFSIENKNSISDENDIKIVDLSKKIKIYIIGKNKSKKDKNYSVPQRNFNIQNEKQAENGKHKIIYNQDQFKKIPQFPAKTMRKNNFYYNWLTPNMNKYNDSSKEKNIFENNN